MAFHELFEAHGEAGKIQLQFLLVHLVALPKGVPCLFYAHLGGHPALRVLLPQPPQLLLPLLLQLSFLPYPHAYIFDMIQVSLPRFLQLPQLRQFILKVLLEG